ncbi:MAG: 2'-5' RNA ligase [Parcubacteria group bacterium GW2011_GWA2_43_9b]|uniref:RNA 2',3'-cyclic phosphodiesterase n=1 Tax=Candidatus Portnoybacteria bacterium RIFCSPLOWO2_02_FULL_39_11 TaxID=1802001 RepID=A0A1G2FSS5_9BACT|nr:MAG: 2'-5' RNA ligase [Parcubacteria group bacterium GW2011_GWA2_43_9b]OGZ41126.1 MAG: 2'-5' RNA ligase [Candidatus Portnoybacteria bacterium RIFCSPLOWO2_02_FULL_39_11]
MTKRRIFIAVNLPEKIKKRLKEYKEKHDNLSVRWTKIPSLHLTLVFIGYVDDEQMLKACKITREVASEVESFFIYFKRIILGPPGKEPRMIWLEGEKSDALTRLRDALQEALFSADAGFNHKESRPFSPHITLAKIKSDEWCKLLTSDINNVGQDFQAQVEVNSIEVMESDLKYDGAEYAALESCFLGK